MRRHTRFVDESSENETQLNQYISLKRQRHLSPPKETTKRHRLIPNKGSRSTETPSRIPLAINTRKAANEDCSDELPVPIFDGEPSKHYTVKYRRHNLAGTVAVAVKSSVKDGFAVEAPEGDLFVIRSLSGSDIDKRLLSIRQLRDKTVVKTYEIYASKDGFYIVSEFMYISLVHVCRCPKYLEEEQLISVISQVKRFASFDFPISS